MKSFVALVLILPLCAGIAQAQKVSFSGFGATGAAVFDRNPVAGFNQEFYYEGKLQADIELSKKIEGQLDFRGHSENKTAVLREATVTFKHMDKARIKVGNIKKPFSLEGLSDRDEYIPVNDSYMHSVVSDLGYDGRNVGVLVYYNYKEKNPEFPFSYAAGVFRNQSYVTSAYLRGTAHSSGGYSASLGGAVLQRGRDNAITTVGLSTDAGYRDSLFETGLEAVLLQDPEEGIRRRLLAREDRVYTAGLKSMTAVRIDLGGDFLKVLEPYLMLAWFVPDLDVTGSHRFEIMTGANVFVDDDVRLRLCLDALLTRDSRSDKYSSEGSSVTVETFFRY